MFNQHTRPPSPHFHNTHPVFRGLQASYMSGAPYDIRRDWSGHGRDLTRNGTSMALVTTRFGTAWDFTGSRFNGTYSGVIGSNPRTVECLYQTDTAVSSTNWAFGYGASANGQRWDIQVGTGGKHRLGVFGGYKDSASAVSVGVWYHFIATSLGGDATDINLYINGDLDNGASGARAIATADSSNICVGSGGGGSNPFNGRIVLTRLWDRQLGPGEAHVLYEMAMDMQKQPRSLWPVPLTMIALPEAPPVGPTSYDGTVVLFNTKLDSGVASNSYKGITFDEDGNLRVSGTVYEG